MVTALCNVNVQVCYSCVILKGSSTEVWHGSIGEIRLICLMSRVGLGTIGNK